MDSQDEDGRLLKRKACQRSEYVLKRAGREEGEVTNDDRVFFHFGI